MGLKFMQMVKNLGVICVLLLLLACQSAKADVGGTTNSPWARVVMIGASGSAGFVLMEPFGGTNTLQCRLSYYLDAALKPAHPPVHNFAQSLLFMNPEVIAPPEVTHAVAEKPTLVIGVDFLFWFCYGTGRTDAERAQRLEAGLKLLEPIQCPLVIGDIPDASYATNTGIIDSSQVPSSEARTAANRRLREWAAARSNVVVVPLADFMATVMADKKLTVHGTTIPAGKTRALLQGDQLHPTPQGAAILALGILDALTSKLPKFSANDIRWSPSEVYKIGYDSAKPPVRPAPKTPATVK